MTASDDAAAQVRALQDRLRILSDALGEFAEATTDYQQLLDVVARKLAEVVKDGCVLRLLSPDGWLRAASIHMPIESRVSDAQELVRLRAHIMAPHHVAEQTSGRRVLETGEASVIARLDLEQLRASATPEIFHVFETIGIHSSLMVALRVRGESIGLLSLVRFEPESPPFNEQDRDLAQALAHHAALAISNARSLQSAVHELDERKRAEAALRKTEEQLRHAQKMEAVGRLAGGVAHDFNNLLSVVLSYADMVSAELKPGDPFRAEILEIKRAGERATDLTKQLLALSRQQVLELRALSLSRCVAGVESLLRRLLGADIELTALAATGLWSVRADAGGIEQILMNLAVNARDAMPDGGRLTIETANVELDEDYANVHHGVSAGPYVMLAVTDTGVGMDKETQARIFEPFFTTKETGKGTGLGLSIVFGIVKQLGGHIWVYSEPGRGTTFKLYLPKVNDPTEAQRSEPPVSIAVRGSETILLVEDDDQVRALARGILRRNGYVVLEASNGGEALLICEQHGSAIHLLLTDLVLPRMSGRQLADRLAGGRPEMKVLFMSGYTDDSVFQHGVLDSRAAYLQKPITPASLTRKVRGVLDGSNGRNGR